MGTINYSNTGMATYTRTNLSTGAQTVNNVISSSSAELRSYAQRRRPKGWLKPTAFNYTMTRNSGIIGSAIVNNGLAAIAGSFGRLPNDEAFSFVPLGSRAENECIIKALTQLKSQSVNLGVALAEAQQTADLVGKTATRLGRAYNSLKRKDAEGVFDALGIAKRKRGKLDFKRPAPDNWLELQYGWKPLLGDVKGSVDELTRKETRHWRATGKGRVSEKDSGVNLRAASVLSVWLDYVYERESSMYVRLDYMPNNAFLAAMSRAGVANPFEIMWEKVPYSFIVDWFLPIGDFLHTLDATVGWEFVSGSCSTFSKSQVKARHSAGTSGSASGSFRRVSVNRKIYQSSPLPKPPSFKNPVSLGHMANGLSLLASAFGR